MGLPKRRTSRAAAYRSDGIDFIVTSSRMVASGTSFHTNALQISASYSNQTPAVGEEVVFDVTARDPDAGGVSNTGTARMTRSKYGAIEST